MDGIQVGDKVVAKIWPKPVTAFVASVNKDTVTLDVVDEAGRALTVLKSCLTKVPTLNDIGFAVKVEVH